MYVFQILSNSPGGIAEDYRNTELYKACVAAGLIPSSEPAFDAASGNPARPFRELKPAALDPGIEEGLSQEISIRIEGMWCVACSWLIEQLVLKMDGVLSANIFFFSDMARIKYMPHLIQPRAIMEGISRLGYKASEAETSLDSLQSGKLVLRLGISAILSMNIMMISFALWAGFFGEIGEEGAALFSYTLWVIASPVVFYGGWPILRGAFWSIRHLTATMDTLIGIGVLAAYFYSVAAMLRGSLYIYFDVASMLVTLVLLGRFIEIRAKEKIAGTITALFHATTGKVRVLRDGRENWTATEKVSKGDLFLAFPGERIPVDGRILSGEAVLDESVVSGESRPVRKAAGAEVHAGSLMLDGDAKFEADRPGSESSLIQLITLIQEALSTKNRLELFSGRFMRVLVPAVLALSALIFIFLLNLSVPGDEALLRALAVLVVTCPCALGIAIPLARVAEIARAKASAILIRNPAALEIAERLDVMIFDKTGTLTEGSYVLRQVVAGPGLSSDNTNAAGWVFARDDATPAAASGEQWPASLRGKPLLLSDAEHSEMDFRYPPPGNPDPALDEALRRVASAEVKSDHYLAREIVKAARERSMELEEVLSFEAREGMGIIASIRSGEVVAGSRALMADCGLEIPAEFRDRAHALEAGGSTVVFFAWDNDVKGFFVFGDKLRDDAREIISRLKSEGIAIWVVSGDSEETTRTVAIQAGADNFAGQKRPRDKAKIIEDLRKQGKRVAMVGDGINDAAALARADIGITLGAGANLIRECSDAAVLGNSLLKVAELLELSSFSSRISRQNLVFSFLYNIFGIPLAACGILNPLIAAFAMFASSVTVICNTSRISRFTGCGE
jgi:cation transport ATPase